MRFLFFFFFSILQNIVAEWCLCGYLVVQNCSFMHFFYIHRILTIYQLSHYNTFSTNWDWIIICSNNKLKLNTRTFEAFELWYTTNYIDIFFYVHTTYTVNYIREYHEFRNGYICSSRLIVKLSQGHSIAGHWIFDTSYNIMK